MADAGKKTRVEREIETLESNIVTLKLIPKGVAELVSFLWAGYRMELHPVGDEKEEEQQAARKMRGILERLNVPVVVGKEEGVGDGDDKMYLDFTIDKRKFRIMDYMPKTCRLVKKTTELPAEPAKVIEAKPARTVTRTVIECDGLPSKIIKTEVKIKDEKSSKEQIEEDLDAAELET